MVKKTAKKSKKPKQKQKQVVNVYYNKPRRQRTRREIPRPLIPMSLPLRQPLIPQQSLQTLQPLQPLQPLQTIQPTVVLPRPATTMTPLTTSVLLSPPDSNKAVATNLQSELRTAIKDITDKHLLSEKQFEQLRHAVATQGVDVKRGLVESREHTNVLAHEIANNRRQADLIGRLLDETQKLSTDERAHIMEMINRSTIEQQEQTRHLIARQDEQQEITEQIADMGLETSRNVVTMQKSIDLMRKDLHQQTRNIIQMIDQNRTAMMQQLEVDANNLRTQLTEQINRVSESTPELLEQQLNLIGQQLDAFNQQVKQRSEQQIQLLTQQISAIESQLQTTISPEIGNIQSSLDEIHVKLETFKRQIASDIDTRLNGIRAEAEHMIPLAVKELTPQIGKYTFEMRMKKPRRSTPKAPRRPRLPVPYGPSMIGPSGIPGPLIADEDLRYLPGMDDIVPDDPDELVVDDPESQPGDDLIIQGLEESATRIAKGKKYQVYDPDSAKMKSKTDKSITYQKVNVNGRVRFYYVTPTINVEQFNRVLKSTVLAAAKAPIDV